MDNGKEGPTRGAEVEEVVEPLPKVLLLAQLHKEDPFREALAQEVVPLVAQGYGKLQFLLLPKNHPRLNNQAVSQLFESFAWLWRAVTVFRQPFEEVGSLREPLA